MGGEVLFPPTILCQDEGITLVDDMTDLFRPALASGAVQVQVYGGPRIKMTRRVFVRMEELGKTLSYLQGIRGKGRNLLTSINYQARGSFSDAELLSNNTLANGTTGFTAYDAAIGSLSAGEKRIRAKRLKSGNYVGAYQTATVTAQVPYAVRGFAIAGRGEELSAYALQGYDLSANSASAALSAQGGYLKPLAVVPLTTTLRALLYNTAAAGAVGEFFEIPWMSVARCMMVDNGPNLLQYSSTFDNAYWTAGALGSTVAANSGTAPDGNTTADGLRETAATSTHEFRKTGITVPSAAADYSFSVAVKAGTRSWAEVLVQEDTGASAMGAYINLSTGAVGNTFTGANWSDLRTTVEDMGNGWWKFSATAYKTNAATALTTRILAATANGTNSYLGVTGSDAIQVWEATLAPSSVPTRLSRTTGAAIDGAAGQTGNALYVKGCPVSTSGILKEGDIVEVGNNLVFCTASLDSDAAGLGYLQFGPSLVTSPADSEAVIANYPLGRFIQASDPQITNRFGLYGEITMDMEQVY